MIDFLSFRVIKQNSLNKTKRRTWEINAGEEPSQSIIFPQPIGPHTIDVQGCFQRTSILRNEWSISAWLQKQKEKNVVWFLEYVKRNNFRRGKGDKLIIVTEAPTRRTSARAQCIPAWVCQQRLPRWGEKLISPRCDAHKLTFASKRLAICVYFYR